MDEPTAKQNKHIDYRFNDVLVILAPLLCPVLALIHGLIGSGTWADSLDAWRGEYIGPFFDFPVNPWRDLLPTLGGLLLGYIVSLVLALGIARSISRNSLFCRLRLIIGIGLAVVGALVFFYSMLYTSLAYLFFIDLRLGGIIWPNSLGLMIALTLIVFLVNAYYLIKTSADSNNEITGQAPKAG
jgi:hypothetical protein